MINSSKNLFFLPFLLLVLLLSTTSNPLALSGHSYGLLGKVLDKVTGDDDKGSDNDDDKGSDNDDDKGSDNDDDKGSDNDDDKGSDNDDDKGSDNDDVKGSSDGNSAGDKNDRINEDNTGQISSVASGQMAEEIKENQVTYVSIISTHNQTEFIPNEVTLTIGSKVIWMNNDISDHRITVGSGSKSEYSLLNSLILPEGMTYHEFESEGTYFYRDLDSPESKGTITVLEE